MAEVPAVSFDAFSEQPRQEFVKCVVVGDTSVGKTRLICSYVYDQPGIPVGTLYNRPRVPTVFAIDQYVRDPSIRDKARIIMHGVPTQLRIWDTFGYHDKNRKYAYQNAHVVVLCFSVGLPSSLRNVNTKWYPEIKKYCPRAPIVLVGTQLDRRYTNPDVFRSSSKVTTLTDMLQHYDQVVVPMPNSQQCPDIMCIPPHLCRQTAREINAECYVEVSIVTKYGVDEIFENAVRTALIYRRQQKPLFCSHLKQICKPCVQKPFQPPIPESPKINILKNEPCKKYSYFSMDDNDLCDITFLVDNEAVHAHSIVLASGCPVFLKLLAHPDVLRCLRYNFIVDDLCKLETNSCYINGVATEGIPRGFEAIDAVHDIDEKYKLLVKVKNVTAAEFRCILEYVYTGKISLIDSNLMLLTSAGYLQVEFASKYLSNILNLQSYMNVDLMEKFHTRRSEYMMKYFFKSSFFADVAFLVDNAVVPAHKEVLISRCSMMAGMFRERSFKESKMEHVDFPDTNLDSFLAVLEYLYTGDCKQYGDLHGTLQLANFLCLPRLITFCEEEIANYIKDMVENGNKEVYEAVLASFNIAQYHNAPQLAAWCLHFMATNYNDLCREASKEMKQLDGDTLKYLEEHRWPPVWYLKEQDFYERSMKQLEREEKLRKEKKRKNNFRSCFFN